MSQQDKNARTAARPEAEAVSAPETPAPQDLSEESPPEAAPAEPASLIGHDELESLQQQLEQALAKAEENWNRYLGALAEMENIRKRAERERDAARKFALEKFVNELLPVRDSLEMGLAAAREKHDLDKLMEGTELTLKMLAAVMEKSGVTELDPKGEKFDPQRHEAMAMQPSAQAEPNTVLQVIQKGYLLNDRLVRPAMVIVAKAAEKA